jgi:hypothetical protein
LCIAADERHFLDERLRDQQVIERIAVVKLQFCEFFEVIYSDGQHVYRQVGDRCLNPCSERLRQGQLSSRDLDSDFPDSGNAYQPIVRRVRRTFPSPSAVSGFIVASPARGKTAR